MRTTPRPRTAGTGAATTTPGSAPTRPHPAPTGTAIDGTASAPVDSADPAAGEHAATDPVHARALFAAWSGDPAVVVASPPGAGKTRLVTSLARDLTIRAGLDVAVAAQTRAQALDVANRAAATGAAVTLLGRANSTRPAGLAAAVDYAHQVRQLAGRRRVLVATTDRWQATRTAKGLADVLIADEAWQMTYAALGGLGVLAGQTVLVGDPGQIAPVVTADTRRWRDQTSGPHVPAPEALCAAHPDYVTRLRLPHTWRLGPATTTLLQPFYDAGFTTRRPPSAVGLASTPLPELDTVEVDTHPNPASPALTTAVVARVRALLTDGTVTTDEGTRALSGADVAVVVPHVAQAAQVAAALHDQPTVLVGTANQLQGLERHAVVVLHPLAGHRAPDAFGIEPARLCVALSRHRSHATIVLDRATPTILDQAPEHPAVARHRGVLRELGAD